MSNSNNNISSAGAGARAYSHGKSVCDAESRGIARPQRFEVHGQADLASSEHTSTRTHEHTISLVRGRSTWGWRAIETQRHATYLYILGVLPSSSGISISNGVVGYVTGI